MQINWKKLDTELTEEYNIKSYGTFRAQKALEVILGDEWIKQAVEQAINFNGNSSELAMNCLRHISSKKAAVMAYSIYKNDPIEDRRVMAVCLIKQLAVKESYNWVEEFLEDKKVIMWGLGVLDQLLWCNVIDYDEESNQVDFLLHLAVKNSNGELQDNVDFIKGYLVDRKEINNGEY